MNAEIYVRRAVLIVLVFGIFSGAEITNNGSDYECPGVSVTVHRHPAKYIISATAKSGPPTNISDNYQMTRLEKALACRLHLFFDSSVTSMAAIFKKLPIPLTAVTAPGENALQTDLTRLVSIDRVVVDLTSDRLTIEASAAGVMVAPSANLAAIQQSGLGIILPASRVKIHTNFALVQRKPGGPRISTVKDLVMSVSFVDSPVLVGGDRSSVASHLYEALDRILEELFEDYMKTSGTRSLKTFVKDFRALLNKQLVLIPVEFFQPSALHWLFNVTKESEQRSMRLKDEDEPYEFD